MAVLVPDGPGVRQSGRPRDDARIAHPALEGVPLEPPDRRVAGLSPPPRVVVVGLVAAQLVDPGQVQVDVLVATLGEAEFADRAVGAGLAGGAVVGHQHHDGVVGLARLLQGVEHPADLRVGVGEEPREQLHHPGVEAPVTGGEAVPLRYVGGRVRKLGPPGHDAQADLALERVAPPLVPPAVESAAVRVAPLRGNVVRGVGGPQRQPQQERAVGLVAPELAEPGDGLVGQVLGEVVALVRCPGRVHVRVVADEFGRPVVGVPAQEPVVVLEALGQRPVVEGPRRRPLVTRGEVPLAHAERGVAVRPQDLGHRAGLVGDPALVAGEVHGQVRQHPHPHPVVVAAGEQARPGGRADGGGVEIGEPDATGGQPVDGRGGDVRAVAAELSEPGVVEHHHHDVGRPGTVRRRGGRGPRVGGGQSNGPLRIGR